MGDEIISEDDTLREAIDKVIAMGASRYDIVVRDGGDRPIAGIFFIVDADTTQRVIDLLNAEDLAQSLREGS